MASRRTAASRRRRGAHCAQRRGGILRQGAANGADQDDNGKAQKAAKAQKARRA